MKVKIRRENLTRTLREIVPAKLKHVDAKLKQATHGYFFNKATKFAEDREATEKEVVKAARTKNKKNKPQNTGRALVRPGRAAG